MSHETKFTPGPWFVSGVRHKMAGTEWHAINRFIESDRRDENIAAVGYDPKTGLGFADAHLIAAAPTMYAALEPFARFLEAVREMGGNFPKTGTIYQIESHVTGTRVLTVEHLLAAEAALSRARNGGERT